MGAPRALLRRSVVPLTVVSAASLSFLLAYALSAQTSDGPTPEDLGPSPTSVAGEQRIGAEDAAKPRFNGEVLGFLITNLEANVPAELERNCATQQELPDDQAGTLDLRVQLPSPFELDESHVNTGLIGCDGRAVAARWTYTYPQANPGSLTIIRSDSRYLVIDVAADRVAASVIEGRDAIVITPLREQGMNPQTYSIIHTNSAVVFPEPFGATYITSIGVPFEEVMHVASLVSQATK